MKVSKCLKFTHDCLPRNKEKKEVRNLHTQFACTHISSNQCALKLIFETFHEQEEQTQQALQHHLQKTKAATLILVRCFVPH